MITRSPIIAAYSGSFDPVTYGHLDIIRRAARLFNQLIVGIGQNPSKQELFTQQERLELIRPHVRHLANVSLATYDGLTIDFARHNHARVMLRGIRDASDLADELQLANVNVAIGGVETVFLMASDQHALTSSTYIKQIFELGGSDPARVERLVPPNVAARLAEKLGPATRRRRRTPLKRKRGGA